MTIADAVRSTLSKIVEMADDEQGAHFLLNFARNDPIDNGEIYALWCDSQGACKDRECEDLSDCCSDEEHTACILRYLQGEYTECL